MVVDINGPLGREILAIIGAHKESGATSALVLSQLTHRGAIGAGVASHEQAVLSFLSCACLAHPPSFIIRAATPQPSASQRHT